MREKKTDEDVEKFILDKLDEDEPTELEHDYFDRMINDIGLALEKIKDGRSRSK